MSISREVSGDRTDVMDVPARWFSDMFVQRKPRWDTAVVTAEHEIIAIVDRIWYNETKLLGYTISCMFYSNVERLCVVRSQEKNKSLTVRKVIAVISGGFTGGGGIHGVCGIPTESGCRFVILFVKTI